MVAIVVSLDTGSVLAINLEPDRLLQGGGPGAMLVPDTQGGGTGGQQLVHTHVLTNTGGVSDTLSLTHTLSVSGTGSGWSVEYPSALTLGSGEGATVPVTVSIPSGAISGTQAVVIRRTDDKRYGETEGDLHQRVDAAQWRGQRVTLRASVRIEAVNKASRGYLWLRVTRPAEPWPETVFYEYMGERPITSREWGEYEITADIPVDADVISYGFAFVGQGQAWVDAVSLGRGPTLEED